MVIVLFFKKKSRISIKTTNSNALDSQNKCYCILKYTDFRQISLKSCIFPLYAKGEVLKLIVRKQN